MEFFSLDILLRLMFPLFILRKFVKCSVLKTNKTTFKRKMLVCELDAYFVVFSKKMDKYKKVIRRCDPSRHKRRIQNWVPFFIQDKENEVYDYRSKQTNKHLNSI